MKKLIALLLSVLLLCSLAACGGKKPADTSEPTQQVTEPTLQEPELTQQVTEQPQQTEVILPEDVFD